MTLVNQSLLADLINNTPWIRNNPDLRKKLLDSYSELSSSWQKVIRMVSALDLKPYKSEPLVTHDPTEQKLPKIVLEETVQTPAKTPDPKSHFSIDLMLPDLVSATSRGPSLGKPAATAITNLNVVTKVTDLEGNEYQPLFVQQLPKQKKAFRRVFLFPSKRWASVRIAKKPNLPPKGQCTKSTEGLLADPVVVSTEMKADRRLSLVTRYLPLYIREQLPEIALSDEQGTNPNNLAQVTTQKIVESSTQSLRATSSKSLDEARIRTEDHRINNLLANSLSFYYKTDNEDAPNISAESSVSDADKEYILPGLLIRSTEEYDQNTAYDQIDDDTEESELEDDEDDYLF